MFKRHVLKLHYKSSTIILGKYWTAEAAAEAVIQYLNFHEMTKHITRFYIVEVYTARKISNITINV